MRQLLRQYFPQWFPVEKVRTEYNTLEVIRRNKKLILNAPHVNYSFGSLHEVFRSTFRQLNLDYGRLQSALILGFGAGSVATVLQKENYCRCQITGVEIDRKVIALARKYFQLDDMKEIDLQIEDAADFLLKEPKTYDLIVVDLFLDHRIPHKFLTPAFLHDLYTHLRPDGLVLFNFLLYDFEAKKEALKFENAFSKVFQQYRLLRFKKHPKNIVFTGRKLLL
jgi:spermidine synthase